MNTSGYGLELLDFLETSPEARVLADGEQLFHQHDDGTDVFVVLDGTLAATIQGAETTATVGLFERGQLFGELSAIAGGPRTASVHADGPGAVAVIPKDDFLRWLDDTPERARAVAARARDRVDRNRAASLLADVLGSDNPTLMGMVLPQIVWRELVPGEVLCREGDPSGAAYLILSGRVSVVSEAFPTPRPIELGRNQIVGELAVLDRLPRTATVTALRQTSLAELPVEVIDQVIEADSGIAVHLFRKALGRVIRNEARSDRASAVAIICTSVSTREMIGRIATKEVKRHGSVAKVDRADIESALQQDGIADAPSGSVGSTRVHEWLHNLEASHEYLLLIGDADATEWSMSIADLADRTLVVSSAYPDAQELAAITTLNTQLGTRNLPWWRAVVHSQRATNPKHYAREVRSGERILHLRESNERDMRRVARLLSGNGIGLALGGGGARGFGHIGAYRAMLEIGLEPDVITGASIGSVMGTAIALDWDISRQRSFVHESFGELLDWTIPLVSFLKGQAITEGIEATMGGFECDSLWRPYSCVVTNLTTSLVEVRDSGPLDRAVRTSVSIPGVLPPMSENGELFVDGGVLNNLPADVVASDPAVSTVIAIDVSPPHGPTVKTEIEPIVSGLSMLSKRLRRQPLGHPPVAAVVMQTMVAGSGRDRRSKMDDGTIDHYIHLDIRGSSLLAFDNIDPVIDQGYESAKEQLAKLFPDGF